MGTLNNPPNDFHLLLILADLLHRTVDVGDALPLLRVGVILVGLIVGLTNAGIGVGNLPLQVGNGTVQLGNVREILRFRGDALAKVRNTAS